MAEQVNSKEYKQKWEDFITQAKIPFTIIGVSCVIVITIMIVFAVYFTFPEQFKEMSQKPQRNELIIYLVSWIILLIISFMSSLSIREILQECDQDRYRKRANYIAIMIGLVLIIFLFKQPYLNLLFEGKDTTFWLKSVLFLGSASSGWVIWYLKQIRNYGEFFNIFLLTTITGFCWYARLTAPEQIQLTAVAFLLGSLFRVAQDYLNESAKNNNK